MNKKLICLLAFVFSLSLGFTACSDDDDDPVSLTLEKTEVSVEVGKTVEVKITQGNGTYTVTPASGAVATAVEKGNVITITGVKAGETTIAVKDKENKTASIKVTVVKIAETYKGTLSIAIGDEASIPVPDKEIKILRDKDKIELLLENFSFGELQLGNIDVSDIAFTEENGTIKLEDKTVEDADLNGLKATIALSSGTIKEGKLVLTLNVTNIKMGQIVLPYEVNVAFTGDIVTNK